MEIKERSQSLVKKEINNVHHQINKITKFNLLDTYNDIIKNIKYFLDMLKIEYDDIDVNLIKNYTLKNLKIKQLNYEDQVALLYLKGAFGDIPRTLDIKYVIIDEAQDYTPLQYEIFNQLFNHAKMTILGDLNQSINPFMKIGDYSNASSILNKDTTCIINLTKSYRFTMEITKFSRRILEDKINDEYVEREGEEPILLEFSDKEYIKERILEDIKEYKNKEYKSIGVITKCKRS